MISMSFAFFIHSNLYHSVCRGQPTIKIAAIVNHHTDCTVLRIYHMMLVIMNHSLIHIVKGLCSSKH